MITSHQQESGMFEGADEMDGEGKEQSPLSDAAATRALEMAIRRLWASSFGLSKCDMLVESVEVGSVMHPTSEEHSRLSMRLPRHFGLILDALQDRRDSVLLKELKIIAISMRAPPNRQAVVRRSVREILDERSRSGAIKSAEFDAKCVPAAYRHAAAPFLRYSVSSSELAANRAMPPIIFKPPIAAFALNPEQHQRAMRRAQRRQLDRLTLSSSSAPRMVLPPATNDWLTRDAVPTYAMGKIVHR